MSVARVAIFDELPLLHDDDERRENPCASSCNRFRLDRSVRRTGRLMAVTLWGSEAALEASERAVRNRPVSDHRGIRPSRTERWVIDARF
jgi:hypothetical protein